DVAQHRLLVLDRQISADEQSQSIAVTPDLRDARRHRRLPSTADGRPRRRSDRPTRSDRTTSRPFSTTVSSRLETIVPARRPRPVGRGVNHATSGPPTRARHRLAVVNMTGKRWRAPGISIAMVTWPLLSPRLPTVTT